MVGLTFLYVGAQVAEKQAVERTLRNALVARDDFVAMVSHDLRNPLTNVLLQANLLNRSMAEHPAALKAANLINMSGQQMQNIIERILDVSSLEAGTFRLQRMPVQVDRLLQHCVTSQKALVDAKSITLFSENRLAPRTQVYCDAHRVQQVFANLFENAIRFTPESGMIRLSAFPFQCAVCFAVEDSGPGIREEQLAHLFDRFWRGPPGSRTKGLGFGLGLHIAKGIVENHGGQIWAANREHGIGAAFLFTLPLAPAVLK
jgi:signal transduction histidine kinase